MKLLQLRRLNFLLSIQLILAYFGEKLFKVNLVTDQKQLIAYFNHLVKLDLIHQKDLGKYYNVRNSAGESFILRKPFSSDYKVYEQVFVDEEYKPLVALTNDYCQQPTVVILDGGANIGFTTLYLQRALRPNKQLHAILVEPFESNLACAELNLSNEGLAEISFERAGLHNKNCFLSINQSFRDAMEWSVQVEESSLPTDLKAIQPLDILQNHNIDHFDVLKLDIEGAERFLFANEDYASEFLQRTTIIAIEVHPEYIERKKVVSVLEKNGFSLSNSGELVIGVRNSTVNNNISNNIVDIHAENHL